MGDPPFRADHVGSLLRRAQLLRARAVHPATAAIGRCSRSIAAIAVVAALVAPNLARAQQPAFHPGLGDLMTAFVQPRHIKLGLAGNEKNWPYAAYELGELRETFDDVAAIVPKYRVLVGPRFDRRDGQAAAGGDRSGDQGKGRQPLHCGLWTTDGFVQRLPSSTGHPMIVIQPSMGTAFPDQDFRPPAR